VRDGAWAPVLVSTKDADAHASAPTVGMRGLLQKAVRDADVGGDASRDLRIGRGSGL